MSLREGEKPRRNYFHLKKNRKKGGDIVTRRRRREAEDILSPEE